MRAVRITGLVVAFALLLMGTVMVFATFDRSSHSASDTLRPFVITMAPVWAVMIAGAWVLLRAPSRSRGA
jgi:Na+-driven multidrug efflux pump